MDATYENSTPFVPPITEGKVVKVYDGDTVTVATRLYGTLYRFSVRLNGIDSPEIRGKSAEEKAAATVSKDALSTLLLNKMVTLKNVTTEKYGRILADVFLGELDVGKWMIERGLAVEYHGGKKGDYHLGL